MRVLRKGTNRSLSFTIAATIVLWTASSSFFLWTTNATPLPDEEICDAWQPDTCTDDPCWRFKGKEHKTCEWIGLKPDTRTPKLCKWRQMKEHCPVTCQVPECVVTPTAVPTASPTGNPTTSPTASPTTSPTASPTSSPTPSPTSSPTSSPTELDDESYPRAKKGVCFTLRESWEPGSYVENLPKIRALNPSWAYSWGPDTPVGVPTAVLPTGGVEITDPADADNGIDYVPMLWGYYPDLFEDFTNRMLAPNPRIVLGFNEPDSTSQSNLSVEYALEGWELLADKVSATTTDGSILVSPSCVQPTGAWCTEFIDAADEKGLRLDAIGFHWYGGPSPQTLFDKLTETHERYGNRPILITEFAVADWEAASIGDNKFSPEQVLDFMADVLPWLEETEWILGYAWFSFETDSTPGWISALVESSDTETGEVVLTPLGQYYSDIQSS